MKSPFPGMDPYVEQYWGDIHSRLVMYACDQLEDQLPGNLVARVEERLVVELDDTDMRSIYPDNRIAEPSSLEAAGGVAIIEETVTAEPVIVHYSSEPAVETFINIIEPGNKSRLVTVIEFLSLARTKRNTNRNKTS